LLHERGDATRIYAQRRLHILALQAVHHRYDDIQPAFPNERSNLPENTAMPFGHDVLAITQEGCQCFRITIMVVTRSGLKYLCGIETMLLGKVRAHKIIHWYEVIGLEVIRKRRVEIQFRNINSVPRF